jgi:hypothetical protein
MRGGRLSSLLAVTRSFSMRMNSARSLGGSGSSMYRWACSIAATHACSSASPSDVGDSNLNRWSQTRCPPSAAQRAAAL